MATMTRQTIHPGWRHPAQQRSHCQQALIDAGLPIDRPKPSDEYPYAFAPLSRADYAERIQQKLCSQCRRWLPLSEFYPNRRGASGFFAECKNCKKARKVGTRPHPEQTAWECLVVGGDLVQVHDAGLMFDACLATVNGGYDAGAERRTA